MRGFKVDSILAQGFGIYEPVVTFVSKTGNPEVTRNKIVTDYKGRVFAVDFYGNSKILIDTAAYATVAALTAESQARSQGESTLNAVKATKTALADTATDIRNYVNLSVATEAQARAERDLILNNTKANLTALSDTAAALRNNINNVSSKADTRADSLKNAVNGAWKLTGNDFFTNSTYSVGIKTGVNVAASTNPYVFMPANRLVLGMNTSNVNDNTGLDKAIMVLDANGLSFNSTSSRMKTGMEVTAESFALCRTNNGSNVKGLQGNFANSNNSTLSLSNVQYGLPSTSSTVFTTSIFAFDSLSLVGNVWNTAWGTSPVSGNSSLVLNKRGGKGYIFKDGVFQEIAFLSDVVSAKTQLPIAPSHAFADQYLPANAFYKLSVNSADLGGASARTVFQK
jgi:hypothetical protein